MPTAGGILQMGPGSNLLIQGGEFVQHNYASSVHNCYDIDDGFKHLQAHVSPAAYASHQDSDAPRCYPNTRKAALNTIMDWVNMATPRLQGILWVNGAAGAGKSAIARSVVDLCLEQDTIIARFFFFRTDPTRNITQPVVATLAYQLIQSIPALSDLISSKIQHNPLIFSEPFETQFKVLISDSLQKLHNDSPFEKPIVILLDGIDECTGDKHQINLIRTTSHFVSKEVVPLIVMFSSRAESHLKMAFNSSEVNNVLHRVHLDNDYRAADDIQLFLDHSFTEIKKMHVFKSSIDCDWPAPSLIQEIVDKSSCQFIYASVVIKFISSPRHHPVLQLEIVRGLRPAGELAPFAELDALYQHIFSQVQDPTRLTSILAVTLLSNFPYIAHLRGMLDISEEDIDVALADLTSLVSNTAGEVAFLHASLPDFLLDRSRAQRYYIDRELWCTQFAEIFMVKRLFNWSILSSYLSQARCTPQLRQAIYTFHPQHYTGWPPYSWAVYVNTIKKMNFDDGGDLYRHQLDMVVRHLDEYYPAEMHYLQEKHDISGIISKISMEKEVARVKREIENRQLKKASFWVRVRRKLRLFRTFKCK